MNSRTDYSNAGCLESTMSNLAEYAREVHEASNQITRAPSLTPIDYPSKTDHLVDIRAVICDVYGTLVNYWRPEFADALQKELVLRHSFRIVADTFGMTLSLKAVNPAEDPEKTLSDFYHGLIALRHDQAKNKGIPHPEILIEEVWELILTILKRHGYVPPRNCDENIRDFSRKIAWFYNYQALGRQLYPGVVETLVALKNKNIVIGLLSNAQFYTPIDLTLMLRDQGEGKFDDIFELFDTDLSFLSYEYLVAKPDQLLFRKLYDALYEYQILPEQTVYIGNDLSTDIVPAQQAGMKTALFTGDKNSAFINDDGGVLPDITFSNWTDLIDRISFHSEEHS
jgi:putative hydrolase of the HAD superfamily